MLYRKEPFHGAVVPIFLPGVLAGLPMVGCAMTSTAPSGAESFRVRNVAVFEGEWMDPQFGVDNGESGSVVNAIKQMPYDRNTLIVAGDDMDIRS